MAATICGHDARRPGQLCFWAA